MPLHAARDTGTFLGALLQQLSHEAAALMRSARSQPLLYSYQSDATSFKCRMQLNSTSSEGRPMQLRGRALEEFLSERGMLKTIAANGEVHMVMLMGVPRPLRHGKTGDCHFAAACDFERPLRLSEHGSILISHVCFDRAIFTAVRDRCVQLRAAYMDSDVRPLADRLLRASSDWFTAVGCCAHDMHNGTLLAPTGSLQWDAVRTECCAHCSRRLVHCSGMLCTLLAPTCSLQWEAGGGDS